MLTPDELLRFTEGAEEIAEYLHQDIIARLIEAILRRLSRGDDYLLTAKDKWMIEVLQESGYLLEDIRKEISKRTKQQQSEIKSAMEEAGVKALAYDHAIYEAAGLSPKPLTKSPHLIRLMQRNYEATMGEWRNFTRTTAKESQRLFINAVDKAYTLTASGAISYTQAIKEAVEEIAEHGVVVEYPSGRKDTIETATARAVRTGIAQSASQICLARMEEMDWDIILVSSHLGARIGDGGENHTNHSWWQGKFYSKSGNDKRFPPFSVCGFGKVQGLDGPNCRHSIGPGDGEHNPFEQYDSEENKKAYELSQRQRTLERRIRDTKRQCMNWKAAMDNDPDEVTRQEFERQYQKKATLLAKQNKEYNAFCETNGLKRRSERLQIAKWDRAKAAKARGAARKSSSNNTVKIETDSKNPYTDVTDKWYSNARPNSHEVQDLQEYTAGGVTYKVDGNHVKLEYSSHEKEIAELLEREVGGEIYMVPKVNDPPGIRTPDYLFHGVAYDLKTLGEKASQNTMFNRVKKSVGQTRRFIIDVTKPKITDGTISLQLKKIFTHTETRWVDEVVIICGNSIVKVVKRS